MSNWWYATSVDVTNGSKQVKVNDGEDIRYLERGSAWLKVAGHEAVETDGAFENDQGEKIVRLVKEWDGVTDTGRRATAFRTVPDFQGVADKLALNIEASQDVVDNVIGKIGTVLTSTDESVVIETPEGDVEVVPYGRLKADIEQHFNEFVDARQQQIDEATAKVDAFNLDQDVKRRASIYSDFAGNFHRQYNPTTKRIGETELEDSFTVERTSAAGGFVPSGRLVEYAPDEPRLVIDPDTGEPRGILIEEQRTNLLLHSGKISNSGWVKLGSPVITENAGADLFGGNTADSITTTDDGPEYIRQAVSVSASTRYVCSVYLPKSDVDAFHAVACQVSGGASASRVYGIRVNQRTGAVRDIDVNYSGNYTPAIGISSTDEGNFWKFTFLVDTTAATTSALFQVLPNRGTGLTGGYTVTAGTLVVSHMQLEAGAFTTSPIITNGTAVTRTADIVGRTLGAEFNPLQGTFVIEWERSKDIAGIGVLFNIGSESVARMVEVVYLANGDVQLGYFENAREISKSWLLEKNKLKVSYDNVKGRCGYQLNNGSIITLSFTGDSSLVNRLILGHRRPQNDRALNGTISKLTYNPVAELPL